MSTTLTAAAAVRLLAKPLNDLYESGKQRFSNRLVRWRQARFVEALHRHVSAVEKVKTIWQVEKDVKLSQFYYPAKIVCGEEEITNSVKSLASLPSKGGIVIEGTAGQGKSIFLRYLCSQELRSAGSGRIPLFVELRRLSRDIGLLKSLKSAFEALGFETDDDLFSFYLESGKFVLLLDGFDELDETHVTGVLDELERLISRFPETQTIVTSRPNSGVQQSGYFVTYKLAPLSPEDHEPFLKRLRVDANRISEIIASINRNRGDVKSLLTTPLLMTLLVLVYKSVSKIPSSVTEFYQQLFWVMLVRHDGTKPGFLRKRASGLDDSGFKLLFEAFCYACRKKQWTTLSYDQFMLAIDAAKKGTGINCSAENFKKDLVKISCLMIEEALAMHFVHKSLPEFHAAAFVARSSEDFAQKFYKECVSDQTTESHVRNSRWAQELQFLEEIDKYRWAKFFAIPVAQINIEAAGIEQGEKFFQNAVQKLAKDQTLRVFSDGTSNSITIQRSNAKFSDAVQRAVTMAGFKAAELNGKSNLLILEPNLKQRVAEKNPTNSGFRFAGNVTVFAAIQKADLWLHTFDSVASAIKKDQALLTQLFAITTIEANKSSVFDF